MDITIVPTADVKSDQDEASRFFETIQNTISGLDKYVCDRFKTGYRIRTL